MASEPTHIYQTRTRASARLASLRFKLSTKIQEPVQIKELSKGIFDPVNPRGENRCSDTSSEVSSSLKISIPTCEQESIAGVRSIDAQTISTVSSSDVIQAKSIKSAIREALKNGAINAVEQMLPLVKTIVLPLDSYEGGGCFMNVLMAEAIDNKKYKIMELLVHNGAYPNSTYRGKLHLTRALLCGDNNVIKTLLDLGADVTRRELTGKTALHLAAASCNESIINSLVDCGSEIEARDEVQGNTALHIACAYCNRDAVMALYKKGAEFNAVNRDGNTPLSKLLIPVTKADDFHNRSRISLAEELVGLGFALPVIQPGKHARGQKMQQQSKKSSDTRAKRRKAKGLILEESLDPPCSQSYQRTSLITSAHPSKEEKLYALYEKLIRTVSPSLSLQQHCRLKILRCLDSKNLRTHVKTLGLPKIVQDYVVSGDTR